MGFPKTSAQLGNPSRKPESQTRVANPSRTPKSQTQAANLCGRTKTLRCVAGPSTPSSKRAAAPNSTPSGQKGIERSRVFRYSSRPSRDGPSRTAHTRWPRMEHQSGLAGAPALEERPRARISVDDQFVRTVTSPRTRSPCWRSRRRVSPIPRLRVGSTKFERKEVSANSAFRNIRSSRKIFGRIAQKNPFSRVPPKGGFEIG